MQTPDILRDLREKIHALGFMVTDANGVIQIINGGMVMKLVIGGSTDDLTTIAVSTPNDRSVWIVHFAVTLPMHGPAGWCEPYGEEPICEHKRDEIVDKLIETIKQIEMLMNN